MRSRTIHHPQPPRSLTDLLEEWVDAGLISDEQSRTIRQHEAGPRERRAAIALAPAPATGLSLVVEALGYLGGIIMLVGATLLVSLFWTDLSVALRLVLIGATALALIGAGLAVPERLGEAAGRLRSVLWAAGVVATGAFLVVLSADVLDRYDEHQLWIVGAGTAAVAAVLWWLRRTWLQQLALFVPLMLAAVGVAMELTSTDSAWAGAAMWGVAVLWASAAWLGWIDPRVTGVAFGVLGAVLGSLTMDNDIGIALGLATALATVALALWERSLPWLGVAALALLYTTPRAASEWFPGRLSAALTFIITGGLLVGAAVWVARQRQPDGPTST
ncbi:DUF2157 domain-containing protein [Nocardioides guangzhouensis]|uniref:DUF2157 domain-containing protein n=1 Tax=Nocardioides guangzhouensis TaxID=2497878 RepID=A0A4Q4ZN60_9ACTN|nr:DUF2157 domain-containing protein [Nocardioides guangzhouensis]RYP89091.1 DUF2157 domain-containing protein [Nocardioides guangzhouensis]